MSKAIDFGEIRDRITSAARILVGRGNQKEALEFSDVIAPYWAQWGTSLTSDPEKNLKMIKLHLWAYVGISKIVRTIAGLDIVLYEEGSKNEREPITEHRFRDLLYRPNSFMTHTEFFEFVFYHLLGAGSTYIFMDNPELGALSMAGPTRLFPLMPQYTTPIPGKDDFLDGFKYRRPLGEQKFYPAIQVLWAKLTDPMEYYQGLSPLTPAKKILEADTAARDRSYKWLTEGAAPGMVLSTDGDLSPEDAKRMRDEWKRLHKGAKKAAEIAILFGGTKLDNKPVGLKEMEFTKFMEFTREELLGGFAVPPANAGIYRYANYANATVQDKIFWTETILPTKRVIETKFTEHFFPRFGEDKLYMEFDVSDVDVLQEDKVKKSQVHNTYVSGGIMTANEARDEIGLDSLPGGDELRQPGAGGPPIGLTARPTRSRAKGRDTRWDGFQGRMSPFKRRITTLLREYFDDLEGRIKSRLPRVVEPIDIDEIFRTDIERDKLAKLVKPDIRETVDAAGKRAIEDIREQLRDVRPGRIKQEDAGIGVSFNVTDPEVLRWIETEAFKLSKFVTESSYREFRNLLSIQINEGASIAEISKKFDELFGWYRDFRSTRIARTEINTAYNRGSLFGYEEAEINNKEWLSARDDRVRGLDIMDEFDHYSYDGQTRPLDAPFLISGEAMMYPGDPTGSPGNVVNCRCVVDAVVDEILEA